MRSQDLLTLEGSAIRDPLQFVCRQGRFGLVRYAMQLMSITTILGDLMRDDEKVGPPTAACTL